jgi:hypothetical protein
MSELESLFLAVLVIYLVQCLYWVTPGSAVFVLNSRGRGKRKRGGFAWSALRTEGYLALPVPPLSPLMVAAWPAFQLDAEGIAIPEPQGEPLFLPWENLVIAHSDSKVTCNGHPVFRGSEEQVVACFGLMKQLQSASPPARRPMIERWIERAMRARHVARRIRIFAGRSRWLRLLANLQFIALFLLVPLVLVRFSSGLLWRVIVFVLALSALIALEFWTTHKKFFPNAGSTRLKSAVTILLSPVAAIRACDVIARDLLSGCHPLAVAGGVLRGEEFDNFAGEQLRPCRFSGQPGKWYQQILAKRMEQAIREAGTRPDSLLRPAQRDEGCVVYCPLCLSQYVKDADSCVDCGFEGLVPFKSIKRSGDRVIG